MKESILDSVSFMRHNAFFGPEDSSEKTLNIIGVGATGSWVGLLAAKMGWHKFQIWDLDLVESHNLPNQIYDVHHVGMRKIDAFEEVLKRFNPQVQITKHHKFFTAEDGPYLEDAVFIAVDSLAARKDIMPSLSGNFMLDLILETKMGFEHAELNVLDPLNSESIDNYLSILKDDDDVAESACNARIITTLTNIVSSSVVHTLCNFYSSGRRNVEFSCPPKTIFSLSNSLSTYNI